MTKDCYPIHLDRFVITQISKKNINTLIGKQAISNNNKKNKLTKRFSTRNQKIQIQVAKYQIGKV